ncbi:putative iron-regulated membrane protein [Paraburkholderia bannensis]|uniref:Putative iron-regulated membrane protein n=1 Tax=Paraburkholderia bannensis TaxID=765414 RepID=A0A7W9TWF7_9BURK|nr:MULTISPECIES: PepSY domain-containing protein [Paraburkholderia]MBB3257664.1 putative iron-regulated membrane protein [Paraburkholderia sp. WP4_3_2]MBB6102677.1 putative iron-regulated membrane protein [Paraburkholderia bannensis]
MSATLPASGTRTARAASAVHPGYRTLWRWHFYAGLFVMPFLIVLAITGTIYCFQPQIEPLLYPHRLVVTPQESPRLPADDLLARARASQPADAKPIRAHIDTNPARSAEFVFALANGSKESVYLNPYSGDVLGTLDVDSRFMQVDRMLHRKLLLGKPGELLMELAACWTLVMIGTGVALWWPRRASAADRKRATLRAALWPHLGATGRPFWKSLHSVIGIWLAVGALAFVVSGLPWTGSWGKQFKALATRVNAGAPRGAWGGGLPLKSAPPAAPMDHSEHAGHDMSSMPGMVMDDLPLPNVPWAVGAVRVPQSPAAATHESVRFTLDQVVQRMGALGVASGYDIALPSTATGVYTVSYFPSDPQRERTVYIDQYSGRILKDIRYADYGAVSQVISYGTSLHMGRYFGLANQVICTAISLGLAALAVTGVVMWWLRRPGRTVGAPSRERAAPPMRAWKAGLAMLAVIFPLMGATIVAVLLLDRLIFGTPRTLSVS